VKVNEAIITLEPMREELNAIHGANWPWTSCKTKPATVLPGRGRYIS
jgi:hypothetical protein